MTYNIAIVSAMHQHELAIGTHMSLPLLFFFFHFLATLYGM